MSSFSPSQYAAVAVIPMFSSAMSVTGSSLIIFLICRSNKRLSTTYRRLVFGMSVMDIIFSAAYFFSTLPSPKDTPTLWKAIGNTSTCTLQGLCIFVGSLGAAMYSCALSTFFFLTVGKEVREEVMSTKIEPFFHAITLLYVTSVGIYLLSTQSFNTAGTVCLVTPFPQGCDVKEDMECTRGVNARYHFWHFMAYPIFVIFAIILANMLLLYFTVKAQYSKLDRYRTKAFTNNSTLPSGIQALRRNSAQLSSNMIESNGADPEKEPSTRRSRKPRSRVSRNEWLVAHQCFYYVSGYFFTWIFATMFQIHASVTGEINFWLWILSQFFTPLQGFINFLVYIRSHVMFIRENDSSLSLARAFWIVISKRDISIDDMRRRRSLLNRQQNGGSRYTAREWHMRENQLAQDGNHFQDMDKDVNCDCRKGPGSLVLGELGEEDNTALYWTHIMIHYCSPLLDLTFWHLVDF